MKNVLEAQKASLIAILLWPTRFDNIVKHRRAEDDAKEISEEVNTLKQVLRFDRVQAELREHEQRC